MSARDDGGPAFPVADVYNKDGDGITEGSPGMTLRDWFAGQALTGLLSDPSRAGKPQAFAAEAYQMADAMLKARQP